MKKRKRTLQRLGNAVSATTAVLWIVSIRYYIGYTNNSPPTFALALGGGGIGGSWADEPMDMGYGNARGFIIGRRAAPDVYFLPSIDLSHWPRTISVPIWPLIVLGVAPVFTHRAIERRRRRKHGCVVCGHSRDGLRADSPCPECGHTQPTTKLSP